MPGSRFLELPCGSCVGCRMDQGLMWKTRIVHESMMWPESNLFVTLQYSDEKLPASLSLEYSDFQLFMKRLRERDSRERDLACSSLPNGRKPIRFFVAGEYGGRTLRPHFHAILFNTRMPDARWWTRKSLRVGHSELLESLWSHGHAEIAPLTPASAAYVAGYVHKKAKRRSQLVLDRSTGEVFDRVPEFHRGSNRPGLGAGWWKRFGRDLLVLDRAVIAGKLGKVPRYYFKLLEREASRYPEMMWCEVERIRELRKERASEVDPEEETIERRAVREEAAQRRLDSFGEREL